MMKTISTHMQGVDCPLCEDGEPHEHQPATKRVPGGVTGEIRYESDEKTEPEPADEQCSDCGTLGPHHCDGVPGGFGEPENFRRG